MNDSCDFYFKMVIVLSIAYTESSLSVPPPSKALCCPNIIQNVEDVMHSNPKPILHAFTAKKVKFKIQASEPSAAFMAANVKPVIILIVFYLLIMKSSLLKS